MTHDPTTSNMTKKTNPTNGKSGPNIPIQEDLVEEVLMFGRFYKQLYKKQAKLKSYVDGLISRWAKAHVNRCDKTLPTLYFKSHIKNTLSRALNPFFSEFFSNFHHRC